MRALDYPETRPEVDPGASGHRISGGGAITWALAAVDERVRRRHRSVPRSRSDRARIGVLRSMRLHLFPQRTGGSSRWWRPHCAALLLMISGRRIWISRLTVTTRYFGARRRFTIYMPRRLRPNSRVDDDVGHSDPPSFPQSANDAPLAPERVGAAGVRDQRPTAGNCRRSRLPEPTARRRRQLQNPEPAHSPVSLRSHCHEPLGSAPAELLAQLKKRCFAGFPRRKSHSRPGFRGTAGLIASTRDYKDVSSNGGGSANPRPTAHAQTGPCRRAPARLCEAAWRFHLFYGPR